MNQNYGNRIHIVAVDDKQQVIELENFFLSVLHKGKNCLFA